MTDLDPAALIGEVRRIARAAGEVIMNVYRADFDVMTKADSSPVTEADRAAEQLILRGLGALTPGVPIVAEEEAAAGRIPAVSDGPFWLVDPLDGTKEFVRRNGEFTVNIALIDARGPAMGVVHAPALGTLYAGAGPGTAVMAEGDGADRRIAARAVPPDGAVIVSSRHHGDPGKLAEMTRAIKVKASRTIGSSLKFCLVATGEAHIYPRYGRTSEWDTAAGHAVLLAAGGSVRTLDGADLLYGKADFLNPPFIARGPDR